MQVNKELLHILQIPDVIYTSSSVLRKAIIKKLQKKSFNNYYINAQLKQFLNETNDYINIDELISTIVTSYSNNTKYPSHEYYSYDQKPNYDYKI